MAKIEIIKLAIEKLQANMINCKPPLLVAKDEEEVLGIISMFPQLKAYTVSKEQYTRSAMHKTWAGEILFLNGEINEIEKTKKTNHEAGNSLCESQGRQLQVPSGTSKEPGCEELKPPLRQHSGGVQEKQSLPKTSKK